MNILHKHKCMHPLTWRMTLYSTSSVPLYWLHSGGQTVLDPSIELVRGMEDLKSESIYRRSQSQNVRCFSTRKYPYMKPASYDSSLMKAIKN